ncbi:septum formation inhibitor [Robbsia andropogonis]|uniref:Probable septum site-determining protein MinC n=1 Tax=Robbsia andropogonis TaxID=28092 RepID=A0A0F5K125_9BURK|nr:septum site-determining protein MinC [Robbsia andropogonis]KKB63803.1 septum formation inhibitor [Robbsia andropogonis]
MSLKKTPFFELRSGTVDLLHFVMKTADVGALRAELARRFESTPAFFAGESVAVDVRRLETPVSGLDLAQIEALLTEFRMRTAGVVIDTQDSLQRAWAERQQAPVLESRDRGRSGDAIDDASSASSAAVTHATETPATAGKGGAAGIESGLDAAAVTSPASGSVPPKAAPTLIIDRPLRSGQRIYAEGDLVILGQVSNGAEVIAEGNIHVYAPLRGRALAGVHGNHAARIFCTCLEPELISIAGIYRTTENPLAVDVQGKPVQVRLDDEKLIFEPLRLT